MHPLLRALPRPLFEALVSAKKRVEGIPGVGNVDFGDLRRVTPFGRDFGYCRGQPVDRIYIERFLEQNASDIRGSVIEIGEDTYTRRYGGDRVTHNDVLHVSDDNPAATIVGDLAEAHGIASASYDALILTQTLHLIFDLHGAVRTMHRIIKPGGVVLLTVPGITRVPSSKDWGDTWFWSFTERALQQLFAPYFGAGAVTTASHGNVLVATSFLYGLSATDLTEQQLGHSDPEYPVTVTLRAVKGAEGG
jgi:SAM-dependent methyltransferase